jgi:ABC-2 type transport system ATP-binding protein
VIETRDLTKKYDELFAVKSLDIHLEPGDVFGFIGPNGSGKTTTMKMLATLLNPTWGEAYVGGHSIYTHPKEIRRLIGYMPDQFGVYDDMKVIEYLEFFAAAYRINGAKRRKVCEDALELVGLTYKRDAMATSLSRGMNQRLGLARVLLHDPQVLLLDEPASGLDPRVRIEIRQVIKKLGQMGKTIMVSSHILPELADMCNKIGIIERGELLVNARVDDVMKQVRRQVLLWVGVAGELDRAADVLAGHPAVENVERRDNLLYVTLKDGVTDYSDLPTLLVSHGLKLTLFREEELNLETAFMALTKGITS